MLESNKLKIYKKKKFMYIPIITLNIKLAWKEWWLQVHSEFLLSVITDYK